MIIFSHSGNQILANINISSLLSTLRFKIYGKGEDGNGTF